MSDYDLRDPNLPPPASNAQKASTQGYSDEELLAERERSAEWQEAVGDINDSFRRDDTARLCSLASRFAEEVFLLKGGYLPPRSGS